MSIVTSMKTSFVVFFTILDKTAEDKERESWLIDQWVNLTEEKNFLLHPQPGNNVPGAPSDK